jgi:hypothetical protein
MIGATAAQAQQVYANASDGYVNMREEPNANAFIVDVLFTGGKSARLIDRQGNWLHIEYDGQKGYVNSKYVTVGAKPKAKPLQRTLYYVVIFSFSTLDAAKARAEDMPDALLNPVYRGVDKGKTYYRICTGCFLDRKQAEAHQREIKENFGADTWIWSTKGFAECVYRPESLYDGAIRIAPLTPRE